MAAKSQFVADGYTWIWRGDDEALLRSATGRIERWRHMRPGDKSDHADHIKRSAHHHWILAGDETFLPHALPMTNRMDLEAGQIVQIDPASNWFAKGYTHGVIESVYLINGGPRYRVRLDTKWLVAFRPKQVTLIKV